MRSYDSQEPRLSFAKMPLKGQEVAEHNSRKSCWVIVHVCCPELCEVVIDLTSTQGKAYDVTEFLPGMSSLASPHRIWKLIMTEHPGGPKIILKYAVCFNQIP